MIEGIPWPDAITMREAAEKLNLDFLYFQGNYRNLGAPHTRVAGRVIFLEGELMAWDAKRRAESKAPWKLNPGAPRAYPPKEAA